MNKIAIITGASGGLGYALGLELIKHNYKVYSLSRKIKDDSNITFLQCDITNLSDIKVAIEAILKKEKQIDLVINNSGYGLFGLVSAIPTEQIINQFNLNLKATMNVNAVCLPHLLESKGQILNISSIVAEYVIPYTTIYAASKVAVLKYSEYLQEKLKNFDVSVNALIIGPVNTGFQTHKQVYNDETKPNLNLLSGIKKLTNNSNKNGLKVDYVANQTIKKLLKRPKKLKIVIGFQTKILSQFNNCLFSAWKAKILYMMFGK